MNIARRAIKGIFWTYTAYIWQKLLVLIIQAILARLLFPEDFGLVAFALIIMTLIESVRGFGINDALIYTSEKVEEAAETAFVINTLIGVAQFLLAFLIAPYAVHIFDDVRIVPILRVISLIFIFDALGKTHEAMLEKELKFKESAMPRIVATAIKGIVSVVMALTGYGVWSIVIGNVIGALVATIGRWIVLRWIPRFRFYMESARSLWDYGVHVLTFTLMNVALEQADQMLIATLLGAVQLGYYSIGVKFPELVIANFSLILTRAIFPTFSKFQNDIEQLKIGFLTTTKYTALITVPMGLGMVAVAPELVPIAFGEKYLPAIILMQVLALLGMVATLQWTVGDVLKALGRPDMLTKLLVIEVLYSFPMIYIFVATTHLAVMASLANLISVSIGGVTRMVVISRFIDIRPRVFYDIFRSPFIGGGLMFIAVWGWRSFALSINLPLVVILIISIIIGAIVYLAFIWVFEKSSITEALDMISSTIHGKSDDEDDGTSVDDSE